MHVCMYVCTRETLELSAGGVDERVELVGGITLVFVVLQNKTYSKHVIMKITKPFWHYLDERF